jgi:outer membrane protein, multidrug efflux system
VGDSPAPLALRRPYTFVVLALLNLRAAVTASREYRRLANVQYTHGLIDYLVVIDAERTLLANQLSLAQMVNLNMAASIRLIKALGGGWDPESESALA